MPIPRIASKRYFRLINVYQPPLSPTMFEHSSPQTQIQVNFVLHKLHKAFSCRSHPETNPNPNNFVVGDLVHEEEKLEIKTITLRDPYVFFRPAVHEIMSKALGNLGIKKQHRDPIIERIVAVGRNVCNSEDNVGSKVLPICVEMVLVKWLFFEESVLMEVLMGNGEGTNSSGMVPASPSSITSLKRKRVEFEDGGDGDGEKCVVCLEGFGCGEEVTCMPCAHMFHEDCITEWLGNSHFCPVCRFEMPKAKEDR